jgi:hypothetical protein
MNALFLHTPTPNTFEIEVDDVHRTNEFIRFYFRRTFIVATQMGPAFTILPPEIFVIKFRRNASHHLTVAETIRLVAITAVT